MKKNKIIITTLIVIIVILIAYISLGNNFLKTTNISSQKLPPSNVECFNRFMERANGGGYADGFRIPSFNFSDILYFKCASQVGFDQYEISGIDKEGHSFYVHKDEGGMAASGADTIYNLCYKQDNIVIRNDKLNGREPVKEIGTCFWTDNFPSNPTSTYKYSSR